MAVIVPAAIAAGIGIYKLVDGNNKQKKADRMAAANVRPVYNIPQTDYDNLSLSESRASTGLGDSSTTAMQNNYDRGLSASISGILKGGGDANATANAYDNYLTNINQMTLADDAAKINNIKTLMGARYRMSDQLDKQWQINKYGPYADKQQEIAQLRGMGYAEKDAGLGMIGSAAMSGAAGLINNAKNNKEDLSAGSGGGGNPMGDTGGGSGGGNPMASMGGSGGNGGGMFGGAGGGMFSGSGGSNGNVRSNVPYSNSTNNFTNNYGIDISKMNSYDAAMVNSLLYNNNGGMNYTGQRN